MTQTTLIHEAATATSPELPCTWNGCGRPIAWLATVPCCGETFDWCDDHHDGLLAMLTPTAHYGCCPRCNALADVRRITWTRGTVKASS